MHGRSSEPGPMMGLLALWRHLSSVDEEVLAEAVQQRETRLKALDDRIWSDVVTAFAGLYGPGSHNRQKHWLLVLQTREQFRVKNDYMKLARECAMLKSLLAARKDESEANDGTERSGTDTRGQAALTSADG